ncbi:MAG: ATP-dependent zinc metalloprotease FtsH [uncultured marine phage]|uniref:ATP-dependent zinc metalloprotease FtsH n=1 Tax=uncultured marine phage TaxID=707152 RepID=A0A8D9CC73_9VIRU|nr:MAG: ATP-dependent zinc metalloprotease FtsH [uncultured marine phage]
MDKKSELLQRTLILDNVKKKLKKEYVGIDDQIDELMSYLEPWYVFNDIQNKPTVVNLWGMTGVGKTSLIQSLFKHLDLENDLYRFDVRTLLDDDKISTKLGSLADNDKKTIGIIFDEFQNARTLDEMGSEEIKSGLRGLWDLLDSGKIEMTSISYVARRIYFAYTALRTVVDSGVKIKKGVFQSKIKFVKSKMAYDKYNDSKGAHKNHIGNYMGDTFYDIKNDLPEYVSYEHICGIMDELDTDGVIDFFETVLDKLSKPKIHDFTRSIIFIIGNLDEVYTSHDNFNPDMDADMLNSLSEKITVTDVKSALSRRFRSEQIARLGNNHLIYSTLDVDSFKTIIDMELKKINSDINKKYKMKFNFRQSMRDILYKESVFPTQGARPVYSRVNSIIRPIIAQLMKKVFEKDIEFDKVTWDYKDKKHRITLIKKKEFSKVSKSIEFNFDFPLQIEDLRESKADAQQCKTAVHEAGHAVTSIVDLKLLPKSIYSKTADSGSKGFCSIDLPEERTRTFYNDYIKVCLGGYAAEKMVFGEDELGDGCYGDFSKSTSLASKMVKLYGMYDDPMIMVTHNSPNYNLDAMRDDGVEGKVKEIVMSNLEKTNETLENYKTLLFKISDYLSNNSYMDQKTLTKIVSQTNPELLDKIRNKEDYFNFKGKFIEFFGDEKEIKKIKKKNG